QGCCAFKDVTAQMQPGIDNTVGRRLSFGDESSGMVFTRVVDSSKHERAINSTSARCGSHGIERIFPPPLIARCCHRFQRDIASDISILFRSQYCYVSMMVPLCKIQKPFAKDLLRAVMR